MTRRQCLSLLPIAGVPAAPERFLLSRQAPGGGWHSTTYGLLRSGQSLTAFVLSVLRPDSAAFSRGLSFLRRRVTRDGAVGLFDPMLPDYPNYATSLSARALLRAGQTAAPLLAHLLSRQFSRSNGWMPEHSAFGAWGMGGHTAPVPPFAGHVDLSMTRHCLEALSDALPAEARYAALVFLSRCQNDDGGFHFSTVVQDANKAGGDDGGQYRSYGTATADGILSMMAAGGPADRINAARTWLLRHHRPDAAPGFRGEAFRRWPQGLRYYYAAASAATFRALGVPPDHDQARLLRAEMRRDGSWANTEPLVKEDDPLIATTFALQALA